MAGASHDNASAYTLASVHATPSMALSPGPDPPSSTISPLFSPYTRTYGTTFSRRLDSSPQSSRNVLVNAALKMVALFVISVAVLGGTLWLSLPSIDE